jgi:hypothetical protein
MLTTDCTTPSKVAIQLPVMQREEHTIRGPGDIYLHTVDPRIQSHPKCFHLKLPEETKSHQHIYLNLKKWGEIPLLGKQNRNHWESVISRGNPPSWGTR